MHDAIEETDRRREIQYAYNVEHGITPTTIISSIKENQIPSKKKDEYALDSYSGDKLRTRIARLELEMDVASANMEYEKAAEIRDELLFLKKKKS